MNFLISGGAGFVGSHVCDFIFKNFKNSKIIIIDKLTYAGSKRNLSNIINSKRVKFIKSDINDYKRYIKLVKNIDVAINIAAESHVDNSFTSPLQFTYSNAFGAQTFIQSCIQNDVKKIIHISSDEVYGEKLISSNREGDNMNPTNPYSASKAAADMLLNSYKFYYKKDVIIIRANNMYGIRQYPEKLISRTIKSFMNKELMEIHGNGKNIRHYLSVFDFANALSFIIKKVNKGIYNIGSEEKYTNLDLVKKIAKLMNVNYKDNITHVPDRLYNDKRYCVSSKKIQALGWQPSMTLNEELPTIIDWYKNNKNYFKKSTPIL